jgi:hypothetical protein
MKGFGEITGRITKELAGKQLIPLGQSNLIKKLSANAITLPGEVFAMQGTSAVVSFMFGEEVNLTSESWLHTIAMVIGLRVAHMGT